MVKIHLYAKRWIYTSKYGEELNGDDVPESFAFLASERFSNKEELIYTAYGKTREDAEKAKDAYISAEGVTLSKLEYE